MSGCFVRARETRAFIVLVRGVGFEPTNSYEMRS